MRKFIQSAALLAAGSFAGAADAATVIETDFTATEAGTLINIGGVGTAQYGFFSRPFGDPADAKNEYFLQSNDGVSEVGTLGNFSSTEPTFTGNDFLGPILGPVEGVELRFTLDDVLYEGDVELAGNGELITRITYDAVAAVPEPAAWAMMILGLGATGGALRAARRRQASPAHA